MNAFQMMQMMRNPSQFVQNMANNSRVMQNPIAKNTIDMMNRGDTQGLAELGRNLCKERGLNPDEVLKNFRSQMGL